MYVMKHYFHVEVKDLRFRLLSLHCQLKPIMLQCFQTLNLTFCCYLSGTVDEAAKAILPATDNPNATYLTLMYANGPGPTRRLDLADIDTGELVKNCSAS